MLEKKELKNLSKDLLKQELDSLKKELFNLRMNRISGQVKDTSQFNKLKIQIARVQTFLGYKE